MSLISDALKRTQQNTSRPSPRPPMLRKPASAAPAASSDTSRNVLVLVVVGMVLVGGGALFGLWQLYSMFAANAKQVAEVSVMEAPRPAPVKEEPKPVKTVAPPPIPDDVKAAVRAAQLEPPKPKTEPVVATPPPAPPPVAAKPPAPPKEFPKLVLQGVTIHGGVREALISGQIVAVGDTVEGAKVVSIEQRKVKLLFDGREFTVTFAR